MELTARDRRIRFPRRPLIMGILNINHDSFSGDGRVDQDWAVEKARELVRLGADIIDVGGESARTNREAITPEEELERISPFIKRFSEVSRDVTPRDEEQVFPPLLSLNTWRPEVAGPALELGGDILNDMSGLPDDRNAVLCARSGAALLIMHTMGEPKVSHKHIQYRDVIAEMGDFFEERIARALGAGVSRDAILLDPGIDFAKQVQDNLRVYREAASLERFGRPVLLPVSRKSVIGKVLGISNPPDRDVGTAACIVAGMRRGAGLFRVHNVDMAYRVITTVHRICGGVS
ncbi:MAG: dihydropteroate synthase [Verrucomicrobia bacterium 61-8]|nr:MAG: dihydropteroate synthase [Verrucomicrobia bacterium 61-8]